MCQASRAGVLCGTDNVRRLRHAAARCRISGVLCSTAGVMGFCRITGSPLKPPHLSATAASSRQSRHAAQRSAARGTLWPAWQSRLASGPPPA